MHEKKNDNILTIIVYIIHPFLLNDIKSVSLKAMYRGDQSSRNLVTILRKIYESIRCILYIAAFLCYQC